MSDPDEPTIKRPKLFSSGERQWSPADGSVAGSSVAGSSVAAEEDAGERAEDPSADDPDMPEAPEVAEADEKAARERRAGRLKLGRLGGRLPAARSRRFWVIAIAAGVLVVIIGLCAGGIAVISAVHSARSNAVDAQATARLRDADCLELEARLNHLIPPGATTSPAARSVAVQDENAAVRIYVARLGDQRNADSWRQLLDARTAYVEALQAQAKSKTPAFFVAPRTADGRPLSDQLTAAAPATCAGSVRRLAAPDL